MLIPLPFSHRLLYFTVKSLPFPENEIPAILFLEISFESIDVLVTSIMFIP